MQEAGQPQILRSEVHWLSALKGAFDLSRMDADFQSYPAGRPPGVQEHLQAGRRLG